jgi:hypothetical protein
MKISIKKVYIVGIVKPVAFISEGLFGNNHSTGYKCVVGVGVMVVGVNVAHLAEVVHFGGQVFDLIGYLIHGAGGIPFIEGIHKWTDKMMSNSGQPVEEIKTFENHGAE